MRHGHEVSFDCGNTHYGDVYNAAVSNYQGLPLLAANFGNEKKGDYMEAILAVNRMCRVNASGQWVGINDTPTIEHHSMLFLQKLDL